MSRGRWVWIAAVLLIGWLATGLYVVEPDQVGLVRRFGRWSGDLQSPGLHVDLPWPWSAVDKIRSDETRQVSVGLAAEGERVQVLTSEERQSEFFTGDQNLIHVQATAQYRIADPVRYALGHRAPEKLLTVALEAALAESIAASEVDFLLTDGRSEIQRRTFERLQELADRFELGVLLSSVDFSSVRPPALVQPDFQDAVNARNDKERLIHDARSRRLEFLSLAEGQQRQQLDEAASYRDGLIQKSRGDAAYFRSIVAEFDRFSDSPQRDRARHMTLSRLWFESISRIFPRLKSKLFVDPGDKVDVIIPRERL